MKKKILTTVLLLTLPLFLTACSVTETLSGLPVIGKYFGGENGGGGNISTDPVTLTFWGLFEEPEVMDALIAKYNEANPHVTINYDDRSIVGADDYKSALFSRASQEQAPDLVMVHSSWVRDLSGSLTPSSSMSAEDYSSKFYGVAVQDGVVDGSVYAAPLGYDGLALVYNKAHFEEIDQSSPPVSWEEFVPLAMKLTKRGSGGDITRAGAAIGASDNIDFSSDIIGLMLYQSGVLLPFDARITTLLAGIPADEKSYSMDSKPAYDVLTFYTNFVRDNKVWNNTLPEATAAFAQEKVSMIFIPSWSLLDILSARPDLDVGVAPVPQALSDPDDAVNLSSYWMVASPSGSNKSKVAWDFIKFLSQEETQLLFYSEASKYRSFGRPYSSPNLSSEVIPGSYLGSYLQMASKTRSTLLSARSGNKDYSNVINKAINDVLINNIQPEDAMKSALETLKSLRK